MRLQGTPVSLPGGIMVLEEAPDDEAARVARVMQQGSSVDVADGDLIAYVNGNRVKTVAEVQQQIEGIAEGEEVQLGIRRAGGVHMAAFEKQPAGQAGGERIMVVRRGGEGGGSQQVFEGGTLIAGAVIAEQEGEVRVAAVLDAAEGIDLQPGDVVLMLQGTAVTSGGDFSTRYGEVAVGDTVELTVRRGGEEQTVSFAKPAPMEEGNATGWTPNN